MSYEAWGDGPEDDCDHLIDAGWWTAEQAEEAIALLKSIRQNCDPTRCSGDREVCNCDMCAIDRFLKSVE